jgi:hypothetical protein
MEIVTLLVGEVEHFGETHADGTLAAAGDAHHDDWAPEGVRLRG